MKKKYELTLTSNYALSWGLQEALRELLQNGIDQEVTIPNNKFSLNYYEEEEALELCNKASILSKKSLLLGYSSKQEDNSTIGKFGEGYKIALLVLNRLGKKVTIYNYGEKEVWTSRFVKSRRYEGAEILTVFVETEYPWKKVPNNNLTIRVEGISKDDFEELKERTLFLQDNVEKENIEKYGDILTSEKHKSKIFVNGLYISKVEDLKYGYNIKPEHLKIGRDRDLVNDFDILTITSRMWSILNNDETQNLLNNNAKDVKHIAYSWENYNVCSTTFKKFKEVNGDASIPVSTQEEFDELTSCYENVKPVFVSETHKDVIKMSLGYDEYRADVLKKHQKNFSDYESELNHILNKNHGKFLSGCVEEEVKDFCLKLINEINTLKNQETSDEDELAIS